MSAALDRSTRLGSWLMLPLALLLFAQWPLRDLLGSGSREANDAAQWVFALYAAMAIRHTTRVRGHMAADTLARRYAAPTRARLARWSHLCVLPWAVFVLASGWAPTWASLRTLEHFPDTGNPLYFAIKFSAWLMALLMTLQAFADLWAEPSATYNSK